MSDHDPKRWREGDDEVARRLVAALRVEPSREHRDAVWAGITAALGPGGTDGGPSEGGGAPPEGGGVPAQGGAAAPPTMAAPGIGLGAKIVGGALALLGLGAIIVYASTTRMPSPLSGRTPAEVAAPVMSTTASTSDASERPVASAVPVASDAPVTSDAPIASQAPATQASSAPPALVRPSLPSVSAASSAKPSAAPAPSASAPLSAADRLREETEGVRRARRSLRDGDARAALVELEGLDRKFPAGVLEEEREVLRIEALFAAKDPSAARRADRFLLERPQSVHVARIKALLGR